MKEFILKKATCAEWQKWLNQWRHFYDLNVISMHEYGGNVTILLEREQKDNVTFPNQIKED